ncbi:MAG: class I SAM-dependent methyltransferase [Sedimentibacter sp.]|uniref:tRNA (adenine(22)-N(1))-methyltransferase n=1 Tax=Sedimentibacter sp. TaxID=1960295 RepID=UPI003159464B
MDRLECIKSMVSRCAAAADVGTDHGYVAEMLLNDNICERVIATDLNEGPLKRATEYLTGISLDQRCDFRLGSGLTVLEEGEADSIIIAGMGGDLIADIIETSKNIALAAKELILQPMTAADKLRKYLTESGFVIEDEKIVKEYHHYYFIMKAVPGHSDKTDEIYYKFSQHLILRKDPLMMEYLKKVIKTNENIISSIEKTGNREYNEKIKELQNKNEKIRELMSN